MAFKIANRPAELLYQTSDSRFKFKLENGVEIEVDVMDVELVPDVYLEEVIEYRAA